MKWAQIGLVLVSLLTLDRFVFATEMIEVVQSVPIETSLEVPGIRNTQGVWLEMIRSAQSRIDFEQFYVNHQQGQSLSPILDAIREAAGRGVKIRFLVDRKFFSTYPDALQKLATIKNIEVKTIDFSQFGGVQHAKYFIVDGEHSFVGSQNFDWLALSHIHEVGLRVRDAKVGRDLQSIFEQDWSLSQWVQDPLSHSSSISSPEFFTNLLTGGGVTVLAAPNQFKPSQIDYSGSTLVEGMDSAKKSIKIQVMEYSTKVYGGSHADWLLLDTAIRSAAKRGVRVQLMVDESCLRKSRKELESLARLNSIEVKSIKIPEWSGGTLKYARLVHSKYLIIDDHSSWVGSENWSQGYFLNSRDVGLFTQFPEVAEKLNQIFQKIWNSNYASFL